MIVHLLTMTFAAVAGAGIDAAAEPAKTAAVQEEKSAEKKKITALGFAWKGSLTAGLTIVAGNSRSTSAHMDATLEGRGEQDRLTLNGGYLGARNTDPDTREESTTTRRVYANAKFDRFLSEKLYVYGVVDTEKDGVRELDLRWTAGGGVGYQFVESEERNFNVEAGVGYTEENFESPTEDEEYISGRVATHFDTALGDNATFFNDNTWIPSLEDFDEDQLVRTKTGIRSKLTSRLSMEARVLWDWDSSPAEGNGRRDVQYIFGLNYSF